MDVFKRLSKPLKTNSFFLFGARGTGKTHLLRDYLGAQGVWAIDLLNPLSEDEYSRHPDLLFSQVEAKAGQLEWVFIDEIQKIPKLLDVVHRILENPKFVPPKFALTGSSARKLRRGAANLLAGRAFVYNLFPLTHLELDAKFDLDLILNWGSLPKVISFTSDAEREEYLRAYAITYFKEEIWSEHLVEDLDPFRSFVEVAAQTNGTIVNFAKIAKDVGINEKTAKRFFQILEDTLLGFFLDSYHSSVRKRQIKSPKFYIFDIGVTRSLARLLKQNVVSPSSLYGQAFEQFIIGECFRLNDYFRLDYKFSYFQTNDGAEIDLIIERPGQRLVLIEIKSSKNPADDCISHMVRLRKDFGDCECYCLSNIMTSRIIDGVKFVNWREGLRELGFCRDIRSPDIHQF
jgi:predicted AAA+ superfamily ATPase